MSSRPTSRSTFARALTLVGLALAWLALPRLAPAQGGGNAKEPTTVFGLKLGERLPLSQVRRCSDKPTVNQATHAFCWMTAPAGGKVELDGFPNPNFLGAYIYGATLTLRNGRAESLAIDLDQWKFTAIKAALEREYGPPTKALGLVVRRGNRYFTAQELYWKGRRIDIDVIERSTNESATRITFRMAGDRPPSDDEKNQAETIAAAWRPPAGLSADALCARDVPYQPDAWTTPRDPSAGPILSAREFAKEPGWSNVTASIQERVLQGASLDVVLVLDDPDVREFVPGKTPDDPVEWFGGATITAWRKTVEAYKDSLFPGDRLGDVRRIGDVPLAPAVLVHIPGPRSLLQLLGHPRLRCVLEIDHRMHPAAR